MKTSEYAKEIYGDYDAVVERAPRLYHVSRFGCLKYCKGFSCQLSQSNLDLHFLMIL